MAKDPEQERLPGDDDGGNVGIEDVTIEEEVQYSFLEYAMSVIVSRALPDVRDGLKPVHRRILFAGLEAGLRPDRQHRKCAALVGDVLKKYHPHGDQAVYDALARLAQDFSTRYMLIDGQGNFGSIDGDAPAAMRYCVTGDARIRTTEGSPTLAELGFVAPDSEVDLDRKVLDHRGDPVLARRLFHSGDHPTIRIRTAEGFELTGTHNHPILCLDERAGRPRIGWKLLSNVVPGDRAVMLRRPPAEPGVLARHRRQVAVLTGAWLARGFVSRERAGFGTPDAAFAQTVVKAYDEIVGGPRRLHRRSTPSGAVVHSLDVRPLDALLASPVADALAPASFPRVPRLVWDAEPALKRLFLQALFEGAGSSSVRAGHIRISFGAGSRGVAADVQQLLLEQGVVARIVLSATGAASLVIDEPAAVGAFATHVGFLGGKQSTLEDQLASVPGSGRGDAPFGPDHHYASIVSVEDAGTRPVYSVRVDSDDHSFITNGFVSHNTEARLSLLAMELLATIDEETVDFAPNYDGYEVEPAVLPARFPNLLVNGSSGIAVGMATNIPPHNLGEVIDAVVEVLRNPDLATDRARLHKAVTRHIKGPDFPTGALILGTAGIQEAYSTGRGSVKMRAVCEIEEGPKGQPRIVVTELPYQVNKARLAEKIAELVHAKKIEGISDLRDESSREGLRLVIELKRNAVPQVVLNQLYKRTQLQDNFGVNMLALVDGVPRTLGLAEVIEAYMTHQITVVTRRTQYRLRKAEERSHLLEGLIIALDNIDEIVEMIRASADTEEARNGLIARFGLSEIQANHILDMPLKRLTALEQDKIREEYEELQRTIAELRAILADPSLVRGIIADELSAIKTKFADPRRSRIVPDEGEFDIEDLIADEDLVVSVSRDRYIKSVQLDTYRRQGRGGRGVRGTALKEGDIVEHLLTTTSHAYLLLFSSNGRVYRVKAHEIPKRDRTARGTAVVNVVPMRPEDRVAALVDTRDYETYRFLLIATKKGIVKKSPFREYDSSRREGIIAVNLRDGDEVVRVRPTSGRSDVLLITRKGKAIRFSEQGVRPMGRTATGVIGIKLDPDDEVVACEVLDEDQEVLLVTRFGYGKRTKVGHFPRQNRGGKGVIAAKITKPRGGIVGAAAVRPDDEVFLISDDGVVIRIAAGDVSRQGRPATGVRVMDLARGAQISAMAPVVGETDEEGQTKLAE